MKSDLIKRLDRLERRMPPAAPEDGAVAQARRIVTLVLAHDRGGLQEHEAIMEGYARALGYEEYRDFMEDLKNNRAQISDRHGAAMNAFFAAHGLYSEAADVDEKLALIGRLLEKVPEPLRARIDVHTADHQSSSRQAEDSGNRKSEDKNRKFANVHASG